MYCTKCGGELADDAASCAACGTAILRVRPAAPIAWNPPVPVEEPPHWPGIAGTLVLRQPVYAGFWLRAVAYAIDSVLLSAAATPLLLVLVPRDRWEEFSKLPPGAMFTPSHPGVLPFMAMVLPVMLLCGWVYYAVAESSSWQGTLGKRWLGLCVSDLQGLPISFGRASGRFFAKILTGLVPFGVGWLLAGFTARKQALHDMLASCLVVRRR